LTIDLHLEEVEALTSCIEVIRLFGGVKFGALGMKKSIEKMSLILIADPNAKILNLEKNPLRLLF
jgi:hypothetical protein